jgi:general secretion pathway protein N
LDFKPQGQSKQEVKTVDQFIPPDASANRCVGAMAGEQMIRRCAYVIAAMASFSVNGAIGQEPAGANLQGNIADPASQVTEQHLAAAKNPDLRQPPPGGNPLWGIPVSSLSASRRPPAPPAPLAPPPVPVAEAPPLPAEPERPPLTLVGTAIGKPQNVALVLNQTTKSLTRLHVGEAASGWYLRSVNARTMTLEKNSQVVTLSLPTPGAALVNPQPVAIAGRINRKF